MYSKSLNNLSYTLKFFREIFNHTTFYRGINSYSIKSIAIAFEKVICIFTGRHRAESIYAERLYVIQLIKVAYLSSYKHVFNLLVLRNSLRIRYLFKKFELDK